MAVDRANLRENRGPEVSAMPIEPLPDTLTTDENVAGAPIGRMAGVTPGTSNVAQPVAPATWAAAEDYAQQQIAGLPTEQQKQFESKQMVPGNTIVPGKRNSAFDVFKARFAGIGLGDLADEVLNIVSSEDIPTSSDGWYLKLIETPSYKKRFGDTNAMRLKNGLSALTEGEIMKLEQQYRKIMQSYNLPAGFYDSPSDYQNFIANDLSASELADRVEAARAAVNVTNPELKQQLQDYYGLGTGALTAYMLDSAKGQDLLNNLAGKNTSAIAAAAQGFDVGMGNVAQQLGAGDLSFAKQTAALGQAKQYGEQVGKLSNIYGGQYTTAQGLQEALGGPTAAAAEKERLRLKGLQESSFSGSSGADKSSLAQATQGNI